MYFNWKSSAPITQRSGFRSRSSLNIQVIPRYCLNNVQNCDDHDQILHDSVIQIYDFDRYCTLIKYSLVAINLRCRTKFNAGTGRILLSGNACTMHPVRAARKLLSIQSITYFFSNSKNFLHTGSRRLLRPDYMFTSLKLLGSRQQILWRTLWVLVYV